MSANSTSHSSRGRPIPLIPSSANTALEPNTNPKALEEDSRRAELAQQFELLKQMVELEVAENAVPTCVLPEAVVPVSPPKPTFLELAQNALECGPIPVVEARQADPARVAKFQAVLNQTLVTPFPRGSVMETPTEISPTRIAEFQALLAREYVPPVEVVPETRPTTDPAVFWNMFQCPKLSALEIEKPKVSLEKLFQHHTPYLKKVRDEQKVARAERAWPTVVHPTVCTPAQILQMGGIAQDDPYLADLVRGMALECDSLAFHWFRAQRRIAPIYFLLGKARAIVLILYTIALSSGKNVFSMTAWELATIIKVEPDYIGKLLTRYRPMLSRLFYFEKKYCTVDGKPFCEGYIWKVDLEREITVDIFVAQEAVKGDLEMFQQNTRNLEADILAGHTARAYQAKKELNFNTRGQVRKVTTKADLPQGKALEMLERCCARAAGIRPTQEDFEPKNSSSRYEVADAVNAPVGHTRGEHLGWVRRLGTSLAAFLGGAGDLKLWFKVGWTALKLEATNILADVINEVIIRNQDADQRNSSAIILAALFDRGLILQE